MKFFIGHLVSHSHDSLKLVIDRHYSEISVNADQVPERKYLDTWLR